MSDALQKPFPPAVLHGVRELELRNLTKCHVDGASQLIQVSKSDSTKVFLHAGKQKKIGGGQVEGVSRVRDQFCVRDFTETLNQMGSVRDGAVMLEPKLVTAVPPKIPALAPDSLPQPSEHVSVPDRVH